MKHPSLSLGFCRPLDGCGSLTPYEVAAKHLVTHGVILGMTGSGKTGALVVAMEEAARNGIPLLAIDIKGDLPGIGLTIPSFDAAAYLPYVEASGGLTAEDVAAKVAEERRLGLEACNLGVADIAAFAQRTHVRVITPGLDAGELLHLLSGMEKRSPLWDTDPESARGALSPAVSLILRLLGREADPVRSREHVLLSVLAERRLLAGQPADIPSLMLDVIEPPIERIGELEVDAFMSKRARKELAAGLNTLLAAPSFASWRKGIPLDVAEWMKPVTGKTPITIVSVAHLDDEERALVLGVLLEEILTWVRGLPGSQQLKAMIVFDEVYGFLPPHPAAPPTKRPLVALMKQARAFGVGVMIATQNPMDLDYRALSNAGFWCLGRLQTDADRERVLDGLANEAGQGQTAEELASTLKRLSPRWFVVRDAHASGAPVLMKPRWTLSYMRGPMTRHELRKMRGS